MGLLRERDGRGKVYVHVCAVCGGVMTHGMYCRCMARADRVSIMQHSGGVLFMCTPVTLVSYIKHIFHDLEINFPRSHNYFSIH